MEHKRGNNVSIISVVFAVEFPPVAGQSSIHHCRFFRSFAERRSSKCSFVRFYPPPPAPNRESRFPALSPLSRWTTITNFERHRKLVPIIAVAEARQSLRHARIYSYAPSGARARGSEDLLTKVHSPAAARSRAVLYYNSLPFRPVSPRARVSRVASATTFSINNY